MRPESEDQLAEAIRDATGPLRVIGGGTRPIGRPVAGTALCVAGLRGITLHDPGALTLVARAGTPLAEIEAALADAGQHLPFEPMDHRALLGTEGASSIGGIVAANISGSRRIRAGACRDSLIGVRFVDGTGAAVRNGGQVMKNVTGHDLVRLMAGSWGTLGVLSEVSFKLLPAPDAAVTLCLSDLNADCAVRAMSAALGTPFEVSGAAWLPGNMPGSGTFMRVEGFADSVSYRAERLAARLAPFGAARVLRDPQEGRALWRGIRDVTSFHGRAGDVWRVSVKPSDAPGLLERAGVSDAVLDWGGGLIWALVPPGTDLRAQLGAFAGHATLIRADEATRARLPVFQPEPAPVAALSAGLRARFDPRGVLNPGLMR